MGPFDVLTILLTLSGIFSYINYRYIKFPLSIGVMSIGLVMSLSLVVLQKFTPLKLDAAFNLLNQIDFGRTLFYELLGFLIFAGSLTIEVKTLVKEKWGILLLSTVGLFISVVMIGSLIFAVSNIFNLSISLFYCLAFGALISPTDPVIVLGLLKERREKLPAKFYSLLVGESLFNDALSLVLFGLFVKLAEYEGKTDFTSSFKLATTMLVHHSIGGVLVGTILGFLVRYFLRKADHPHVQILMTLGAVAFGHDFCQVMDVSGPIAIVILGLMVGHAFRGNSEHGEIKENPLLFSFWEIIDEFLNSFLFIMVGLEILNISMLDAWKMTLVAPLSILVVIFSRWFSLKFLVVLFPRLFQGMDSTSIGIMTWVGMRGGLSLALGLLLPDENFQHLITITYCVVVFSILIQGLTSSRVLSKLEK